MTVLKVKAVDVDAEGGLFDLMEVSEANFALKDAAASKDERELMAAMRLSIDVIRKHTYIAGDEDHETELRKLSLPEFFKVFGMIRGAGGDDTVPLANGEPSPNGPKGKGRPRRG